MNPNQQNPFIYYEENKNNLFGKQINPNFYNLSTQNTNYYTNNVNNSIPQKSNLFDNIANKSIKRTYNEINNNSSYEGVGILYQKNKELNDKYLGNNNLNVNNQNFIFEQLNKIKEITNENTNINDLKKNIDNVLNFISNKNFQNPNTIQNNDYNYPVFQNEGGIFNKTNLPLSVPFTNFLLREEKSLKENNSDDNQNLNPIQKYTNDLNQKQINTVEINFENLKIQNKAENSDNDFFASIKKNKSNNFIRIHTSYKKEKEDKNNNNNIKQKSLFENKDNLKDNLSENNNSNNNIKEEKDKKEISKNIEEFKEKLTTNKNTENLQEKNSKHIKENNINQQK